MLGHWPLIPLEYPQINLARRALQHILKSQTRHIDPVSQVSTMQLLALVWEAIHDDEHRQGDLHAVRGRLVQCLSEVPKDAECKSYICAGGIFNKIMESLDKLHPDVEILYITHDSIVLKYNIVVNEAVSNYLIELLERAPEPSTAAYVLRCSYSY